MKKILIATTALVATAGVASADVSLSGDARMGVIYDGSDLNFTSRTRAKITLSGESDGGLSFGGSFDVHNASNATGGLSGSVYISGAFGKISMGDVDGAAKAAVGQVDGVGLTGLGDAHEIAYVNGGTDADGDGVQDTIYPNPAALYEYSFGTVTLYAGAGQPSGGNTEIISGGEFTTDEAVVLFAENTYSVGAKWADNGYSAGIGFETTDAVTVGEAASVSPGVTNLGTISQIAIGGSAEFGDFTVKGVYGMIDTQAGTGNQFAVSGTYAMDAISVTAFYASIDLPTAASIDAYGLGAVYDLGGGLSIKGGVVNNRAGDTVADLGLSMSF